MSAWHGLHEERQRGHALAGRIAALFPLSAARQMPRRDGRFKPGRWRAAKAAD